LPERGPPDGGRRPARLRLLWLVLAAGAGLSDLAGQQEAPDAGRDPEAAARFDQALETALEFYERFDAEEKGIEFDPETGEALGFLWGNAQGTYDWKGERVWVRADRMLVFGVVTRREGTEGKPDGKKKDAGSAEAPTRERRGAELRSPAFYAEGGVRIEAEGMVLDTDRFYFERETERGVAIEVRARTKVVAAKRVQRLLEESSGERPFSIAAGEGVGPTIGGGAGAPAEPEGAAAPAAAAPGEPARADPPAPAGHGEEARQMHLRARRLLLRDLGHYEGEDVVVSTCEYAVPHFSLGAERIKARREIEGDKQHLVIDPEESWLELDGWSLFPIPSGEWDTRWFSNFPIRRPIYSHSGKFGHRAGVDWNLDWGLRQLPFADAAPVEAFLEDARFDVRTEYLSERGFGAGVEGEYGEDTRLWEPWELNPGVWRYRGEGIYYWIDDHGEDATGPRGAPDVDDERWWGRIIHRQMIPHVAVVDVEHSQTADDNFLNEFFPSTRTEKEQESLVYARRSFGDALALTGLVKYRANDFETTTERLPEAKLFLLEQPLVDIVDARLHSTLLLQAAELRQRPANDIQVPPAIDDPVDDVEARTREYGRIDGLNEWSLPVGFGRFLRLRPYYNARLSAYETGLDPDDHSIERYAFEGGVQASQEWSRVFPLSSANWMRRYLGFGALKHSIIPKVGYSNLHQSSVDPDRLFQVDEVDAVDELEVIDLSLRQVLWARGRGPHRRPLRQPSFDRPATAEEHASWNEEKRRLMALAPVEDTTHALVDFESSLRWFTRPERDNDGDRFSRLDLDLSLYPLRWLALRSRNFLDPQEELEFLLSDNAVTLLPLRDRLHVTVGERTRRGLSEFYYCRFGIRLGERYALEGFGGFDPEENDRTDADVSLIRYLHRFAVEFRYSFDAGEDDNHTFSVNFFPVELAPKDRWDNLRRDFR
jgi:hypothetical protein